MLADVHEGTGRSKQAHTGQDQRTGEQLSSLLGRRHGAVAAQLDRLTLRSDKKRPYLRECYIHRHVRACPGMSCSPLLLVSMGTSPGGLNSDPLPEPVTASTGCVTGQPDPECIDEQNSLTVATPRKALPRLNPWAAVHQRRPT